MPFDPLSLASAFGPTILSAFGKKRKGTGTQATNNKGFAAAPAEIQKQMLDAARRGFQAFTPEMKAYFEQYPLEQQDIDTNPEFQALQQANPNNPLWQRGVLAQRTEAQKQALELAQNGFSKEALADYYQPYEEAYQAGANEINKTADKYKQGISSQNALLNSRINPETNQQLQGQYADLEQRRGESLGGLRGMLQGRAGEQAIDTRFKHGAELAQRGGEQFAYHQQQLENASGRGRMTNDPGYQQAIASQALHQPFLNTASSTNGIAAEPNKWTRYAGAGLGLADTAFGLYNQQQGQYGPQGQNMGNQNIPGTPWNLNNPYGR
jgi:hypothetical protein